MAVGIDLGGKVVVICGSGAGGIGASISDVIAEAGADIFAVDYSQALLDETLEALTAKGAQAQGLVVDLQDRAQTSRVIAEAYKAFGRIDGVINVAGGTREHQWREIERTPNEMMGEVFSLNFDYVFQVCRDAAKVMIDAKTGGSMVNIASISGFASAPYHALYGAAKAGVMSLSRTMGVEWKRHNIRVNALSPGVVKTRRILSASRSGDGQEDAFGRRSLGGDEIASAALFLISDLSSGVTAQNLIVDAGITANFAAFPSLGSLQGKIHRDPA